MTFGEMLLLMMDFHDMSLTELAAKSGVPKQTINELIKGRTKEPTFSRAKALADALDMTLEEMADMVCDENA